MQIHQRLKRSRVQDNTKYMKTVVKLSLHLSRCSEEFARRAADISGRQRIRHDLKRRSWLRRGLPPLGTTVMTATLNGGGERELAATAEGLTQDQSMGLTRMRLPSGSATTKVRPKTSSCGSSTTRAPLATHAQ